MEKCEGKSVEAQPTRDGTLVATTEEAKVYIHPKEKAP